MVNKIHLFTIGLIVAAAALVSGCQLHKPAAEPGTTSLSRHERADRQARVPNEYLVTLAPEANESALTELFGRFGIKESQALGGETYLLVLTQDPGPGEMSDLIQQDERFLAVQPNLIYWANRSGRKKK